MQAHPTFDQLQDVRRQLGEWRISSSDALSQIEKVLASGLRKQDIDWINDLRNGYQDYTPSAVTARLDYRFYEGNWSDGIPPKYKTENDNEHVVKLKPFCSMPLVEIEDKIKAFAGAATLTSGEQAARDAIESDVLKRNLLEVCHEPNSGLKFMIFPNALFLIYTKTRFEICEFIDMLIIELALRPKGL